MKTKLTSFYWLPVLLPLFFSCQKENAVPFPPSENTAMPCASATDGIASLAQSDDPGGGPVTDCQEITCEDVIEELRLMYLPLANSLCDTLWFDVTCCIDGHSADALVFVAPNDPRCFPQPWPFPMK